MVLEISLKSMRKGGSSISSEKQMVWPKIFIYAPTFLVLATPLLSTIEHRLDFNIFSNQYIT